MTRKIYDRFIYLLYIYNLSYVYVLTILHGYGKFMHRFGSILYQNHIKSII